MRIIRYKNRKKSTDFVPEVMKIVYKQNLWSYIQVFLEDGTFPTKTQSEKSGFQGNY